MTGRGIILGVTPSPELRGGRRGGGSSEGGGGERNRLSPSHLRLRQAEGRGQLHPLWRGQVALDLESFLQAGKLRV